MPRGLVAVVALAGLLAGCAHTSPASGHKDVLGFVKHSGAVEWPAADDYIPDGDGLRILVPEGSCTRGIGTYRNGYRDVTANWTGPDTCDSLKLNPSPANGARTTGDGPPDAVGGWRGGGVAAEAVVVGEDGSLLTAGDTGLARYRKGNREELARTDLSTTGLEGQGSRSLVRGMAVTGSGRILVNADLSTEAKPAPVLLASDDHGKSLRRMPLPAFEGGAGRQTISVIATAGDEVVAMGVSRRQAVVWRSGNGGDTWTVSAVGELPDNTMITRLVRSGGRWVALGGYRTTKDYTYVLSSVNGHVWQPGPADGLGVGRVQDVTVDSTGDLVMVGLSYGSRPGGEINNCGVVWVGDGERAWQRGDLGCGDAAPQAVTTLADGRVLLAGNRDLWLRAGVQ